MREEIPDHEMSLEAVCAMFAQWRSNCKKREPIPPHLWKAAACLCKTHPITRVCRHLRLSFVSLKQHINEAKPSREPFVELSLGCLTGEWRLECERADGAKLKLSGLQALPVEAALRAFLA
jgi:hypothetical protein